MSDVFISFKTDDTPRVQAVHDGFRARGLTVFWSNDIPAGAPDYQSIIIEEIRKAVVVVVLWTRASVKSHPVRQECSQAKRDGKLFQVVLDEIEPIYFPMEAPYADQKAMLIGWTGDQRHPEWVKLNNAIDARRSDAAIAARKSSPPKVNAVQRVAEDAQATSPTSPGETIRDIDIGPEMVLVPPGKFWMGSKDNEGSEDEQPRHEVTIAAPLLVGKYPIMFAEWDAAVSVGGVSHEPDDEGWGRGRRPVINVSWVDAKEYAAWLSKRTGKAYRLLSEAEWEYCCRAGTARDYSFGATITQAQAQFGAKQTVEVGNFPANAFGLHDMHGNVWEWCEDPWHQNYQGAPTDGSAWIDGGDTRNCIVRGGSWFNGPRNGRSALRGRTPPDLRRYNRGFRVARALSAHSGYAKGPPSLILRRPDLGGVVPSR
jgi:formylglycine-generating enzyme required for sulfatase activity